MEIFYDILNLSASDTWVAIVVACLLSFMPFATLGFLFAKHRNEEPSYIIGLDRVKSLKNAWTLLLLIIAPLIFIYNVFVWAAYAFVVIAHFFAYLIKTVYDLIVEYIVRPIIDYIIKPIWEFIKTIFPIWKIIKWIVSSIIWVFWNIFWMPIKMILKSLYHYCILWAWDLYKSSFLALNGTYNKSKLRVTFMGAFYALALIGLSIYLSILTGYAVFGMLGLVISSLPILKAYGTVTSMLHFTDERDHSLHGSKVMKTALHYVLASIVAIVAIEILLLLSWIPDLGLVFLGVAINTNVFLSAAVILSLVVLSFAQSIFPNHLLYNNESTLMQNSVMNYLRAIRDKAIQLMVSLVPGSLWLVLALIIPTALIYISISTSDSFKTQTLTVRENNIAESMQEANNDVDALKDNFTIDDMDEMEDLFEDAIELNVRANQNYFGLSFPQNVIEQPEIIFSNNATDYTVDLPRMLDGAIQDSISISRDIEDAENMIERIQTHITEYKSQMWEFRIQRKDTKDGKEGWKNIKTGTDISSMVDQNISQGKSYDYRIQVVNKSGKSGWSSKLKNQISKDYVVAPSNLRISGEHNFRLVFYWNDNSANETGFSIERKAVKEKNAEWYEFATVGADITQHVEEGVKSPGKDFIYRVKAKGAGMDDSKPSRSVPHTVTLRAPRVPNVATNLKSALVDWWYDFGYDRKNWEWKPLNRKSGKVTKNKSNAMLLSEDKSLATLMQEKIDELEAELEKLNEDLVFANARIDMFASLIDYDQSQRTMLKVFKNFAFLFAILFVALFGGMIISIAMSYIASLFYKVYTIRDKDPWYFMSLINEEKAKNKNQPLLAFTFWFLSAMFFMGGFGMIVGLIM